jgi:hypothetical protein
VLVFEQRHFLRFHDAVNKVEESAFILESYLKTMSYAHCKVTRKTLFIGAIRET